MSEVHLMTAPTELLSTLCACAHCERTYVVSRNYILETMLKVDIIILWS